MARRIFVFIAVLSAAALPACGESEVKRAVDPRTEVLSFFPEDTPAVVLVKTDPPPSALSALDEALGELPSWREWVQFQRLVLGIGGVTSTELRPVLGNEVAAGVPPGARGALMLALAVDSGDRLERLARRQVNEGEVEPSGTYRSARLYESTAYDFTQAAAVRDGVLVVSNETDEVKQAIEVRDGDRDEQLDDGEVKDVLEELPERAPLLIYVAEAEVVTNSVPELRSLTELAGIPERMGVSIEAAPGQRVDIHLFAEFEDEPAGDVLEEGEEISFSGSPEELGNAVGVEIDDEAGELVDEIARTFSGVSVDLVRDGEELRARMMLSP